jgi:hypothetical protein
MDRPNAMVREIDGQLVLEDPEAMGMIAAVDAHNRDVAKRACRALFEANLDRVEHFVRRIAERGHDPADVVIVVIDVDEPSGAGAVLTDELMPGHDWQAYRDRGEVPIARGLATRGGIQSFLDVLDGEAAGLLRRWEGIAVVVVTGGMASVYADTKRA